jgi:hypothetical protein
MKGNKEHRRCFFRGSWATLLACQPGSVRFASQVMLSAKDESC